MKGMDAMKKAPKKKAPVQKKQNGIDNFAELQLMVTNLQTDAEKCFVKENRSAGIRLRKGLKLIKQQLTIIKQQSLEVR